MDLLLGAVVFGVLLGCFYAAVSVGLSVSFGLLDVPHVAHPAFLVLASYGVYQLNESYDIDPLLAGLCDHAAVFPVRPARLPRLLRDVRTARLGRSGARHRVLLRHRLHHRGADHHAVRRRPAHRQRRLYRQVAAARRHAHPLPAALLDCGGAVADRAAGAVPVEDLHGPRHPRGSAGRRGRIELVDHNPLRRSSRLRLRSPLPCSALPARC